MLRHRRNSHSSGEGRASAAGETHPDYNLHSRRNRDLTIEVAKSRVLSESRSTTLIVNSSFCRAPSQIHQCEPSSEHHLLSPDYRAGMVTPASVVLRRRTC